MKELDEEINKLSKDLNYLKQKRSSLDDNNQYLTLVHTFCQEDIQKHNEQIKELESQKKSNDEKISELREENKDLKSKINTIKKNENKINNIKDLKKI